MVAFPNAKINLGLFITGRRTDGYHNLETVFYPLPTLRDVLEIVPAKNQESTLTVSGKAVEGDKVNNLVWRACDMLGRRFPEKVTPLDTYLHKAISMGAGMGGGSADGAFMLRLLNDFFGLGLDEESLLTMALELGSDCPFFIRNTPQFAKGRGEEMEPLSLDLSPYSIQVICPQVHIATKKAFEGIQPKAAEFDLRQLPALGVASWRERVYNDFEKPVFQQYPQLRDIKKQLYTGGAVYASLTGSGSALYGIFPKGQRAVIGMELAFEEWWVE